MTTSTVFIYVAIVGVLLMIPTNVYLLRANGFAPIKALSVAIAPWIIAFVLAFSLGASEAGYHPSIFGLLLLFVSGLNALLAWKAHRLVNAPR
ncbi:hypothetical protein [uncultured Tateyamaria sp.]|uniref:hypothetical protein n=1 Tax=uncultured Tateyamaria sp. TaxID=455651 RepID=UPI002614CAD8|nr:hypothetical protein [uncultured Tateyamaria sp.]